MNYYFITACVAAGCTILMAIRLARQNKRVDILEFLLRIEKQRSLMHEQEADRWQSKYSSEHLRCGHLEIENNTLKRNGNV